jgi:hypothetical protein
LIDPPKDEDASPDTGKKIRASETPPPEILDESDDPEKRPAPVIPQKPVAAPVSRPPPVPANPPPRNLESDFLFEHFAGDQDTLTDEALVDFIASLGFHADNVEGFLVSYIFHVAAFARVTKEEFSGFCTKFG